MAFSPKQKAAAIADLAKGLTYEEVTNKHGVSKACLCKWVKAAKSKQEVGTPTKSITPAQRKENEFDTRLKKLLLASLDMVTTWAEQCSDPAFIKSNPEGVSELGKTVLERCDRIVNLVRGSNARDGG